MNQEPTPEELAALEKERKRCEARHAGYLKRKQSGWQKKHEEKYQPVRKARLDKAKADLRAEILRMAYSFPWKKNPFPNRRKEQLPYE